MHLRRRTALVAFSGFIVLGLPTGMLGIAWPSMRAALDAPLAGLGLLLAAMTTTQFFASGLSGIIRERSRPAAGCSRRRAAGG
jgi:hydrogenase/urease accessory protein HupE